VTINRVALLYNVLLTTNEQNTENEAATNNRLGLGTSLLSIKQASVYFIASHRLAFVIDDAFKMDSCLAVI